MRPDGVVALYLAMGFLGLSVIGFFVVLYLYFDSDKPRRA